MVEWHGRIVGHADGSVSYQAVGKVLRDFETNRTGVCLLHPARENAGLPCVVHHVDGTVESSAFPTTISPHQPFFEIASIEHALSPDTRVCIDFNGEVYEMEDQRNWSDASFKTYPRPHAWPKPYALMAGDEVAHTIDISFEPPLSTNRIFPTARKEDPKVAQLPLIGLLASTEPFEDLTEIRAIGLDHIGVVVDQQNRQWRDDLAQQLDVAEAVQAPIQLYLRGSLPEALPEELAPVEIVLADVGEIEWSTDRVEQVRNRFPGIPIVAASWENFTELNRNPVPLSGLTGLGFGVNPQVHAFDDHSIVEATETLASLVRDARQFGVDWISVGPLTFEPRHWDSRPVDPRLATPFSTAWILACLLNLAIGHANRVTIGFTHGKRGLSENQSSIELLKTLLAHGPKSITIPPAADPLNFQSIHLEDRELSADFRSLHDAVRQRSD